MELVAAVLALAVAGAANERPAVVVHAPNTPVRLEHASILTPADGPPVLVYAATNTSDSELDQFTVMVFVFDAQGTLKTRQVAPGRRTLEAHGTKYSTMVLDGGPVDAADRIVVGVNQAQRVGSEDWWRAELQPVAEAASESGNVRK
ncbi:MAG: hypothetical protein GEU82_14725 [Luteitalea sp.]|nr:hypothetical protein [Luteitalea sp.]